MSTPKLPAIFIPSGVHGELLLGTPDMWDDPAGRYVAAADYLALKAKHDSFVIVTIAADHMRDVIAEQLLETVGGVRCPKCDQYHGGHATGGNDICTCYADRKKT